MAAHTEKGMLWAAPPSTAPEVAHPEPQFKPSSLIRARVACGGPEFQSRVSITRVKLQRRRHACLGRKGP